MKVYHAIAAVSGRLAKAGIAKDRENKEQRYTFRGVDDVYNALAPILADEQLVILPRMMTRNVEVRQAKSGTPLFNVTVEAEFDFVAAEDASKHTVKTFGEAMDSADKATNKAMSAAYKYACIQTFCIPTEGDNDADATTHELAGRMSEMAIADFEASLDEAVSEDDLRDRLRKALAVAHQGGDTESFEHFKQHALKVKERKFGVPA
jgi:hypothetical protein